MIYWDKSLTLFTGCSKVDATCANCWAEREARRMSKNPTLSHVYDGTMSEGGDTFSGKVRFNPSRFEHIHRKKPQVFAIWNDPFHADVSDADILKMFSEFYYSPQHTYLILTKRVQRLASMCRSGDGRRSLGAFRDPDTGRFPENWFFGATVGHPDQLHRLRYLELVPGRRYLSAEPLLGPLDILPFPYLEGVIAGGESGTQARPTHPDHARHLRDQCAKMGISFAFKQWGEWLPEDQFPAPEAWEKAEASASCRVQGCFARVGKKDAGHLLDGVEHFNLPWRI